MSLAEDVRKGRLERENADDAQNQVLSENDIYINTVVEKIYEDAKERLVKSNRNAVSDFVEIDLPDNNAVKLTGKYKVGGGIFTPVNIAKGGFEYKISELMRENLKKIKERCKREGIRDIRLAVWAPAAGKNDLEVGKDKNGMWFDLTEEEGYIKTPEIGIEKGYPKKVITILPEPMRHIYIRYNAKI